MKAKMYQCPYEKACTCTLEDPCLGCETWAENNGKIITMDYADCKNFDCGLDLSVKQCATCAYGGVEWKDSPCRTCGNGYSKWEKISD